MRLQAVDSKGLPVDNYEGEVKVEVGENAALLALDNGDHFTDRRLDMPSTTLYRGGALVILRPKSAGGTVSLKASCTGMKPVVKKVNI